MSAIEAIQLTRRFGNLTALDAIDFTVEAGEVFGYLGANGAGKSTTINIFSTMARPTSGRAVVNGHDVVASPDRVRRSIGVIFQESSLDERLTGWENLRFHALLHGIPRKVFKQRADDLLATLELSGRSAAQVQTYSGGMRRRLEIARALLHDAPVLFLDELTIGLDPQIRHRIWQYVIDRGRDRGTTIFMTTHYVEEAEHCSRIAVIDRGRIVALDRPARIKALVGSQVVTVRTSDNVRAAALIAAMPCAARASSDEVIVETAHGAELIPRIVQTLQACHPGIDVLSVGLSQPSLENAVLAIAARRTTQTPDTPTAFDRPRERGDRA